MKKLIIILVFAFLLCSCSRDAQTPTEPDNLSAEPTAAATEPPIPWVQEFGTPWDEAGVLREMHVTIPDGIHFSNYLEFDGDLLLWSTDSHRADRNVVEMCLLELDDGTIRAQREYTVQDYCIPQALGENLYLCDPQSGLILQLDKDLQETRRWELMAEPGNWYMGGNGSLYQFRENATLWVCSLEEGNSEPVIEGDPELSMFYPLGSSISFDYFRQDTGAKVTTVLNLLTGEMITPDIRSEYETVMAVGDYWISSRYLDGYVHTLSYSQDSMVRIETGECHVKLLEENYLLLTSEMGDWLHLYDMQGNPISSCQISENGNYYIMDLIWNESLGGYFFQVGGYDSDERLLFWDISRSSEEPALVMEPVMSLSDQEQALEDRAEELSKKYGVNIVVGSACDEVFADFTASVITDYDLVMDALDTLDEALSVYPKGFLAQLRSKYFNGIQIQLVSDLIATGNGREGDGYSAFTMNMWEYYLMVMDIHDTYTDTYYHEFSHIIDSYLELDSYDREDALYSEVTWASFNPVWFDGYTYDYSMMVDLNDYDSFVDSYSTISPTEDRARVMEFAMSEYGKWTFENRPGLLEKLEYYCRCIRDTFDTTGWPETVIWEQYLYLKS